MNINRLLPATDLLKHVSPLYQPIINVPQRRVVGFEALTCCVHPRWQGVPPEVFMPMARRSGVLDDMTISLYEQAARDLKVLEAIHVDVDITQLADRAMVERIVQAFAPATTNLLGITFEITGEGEIDVDYARVLQGAERLKALGAQLALEDFGQGHSNFERLCELPVDLLKIPRQLIYAMATEHKSLACVKATLALAESLRLETVAEGVDNFFQIHALKQMGCTTVQGVWYSRPLTLEAAKDFRREHLNLR
ncbi:EAL domain-containing protein [Pseudomonas sp. ANT_J12]|uniref:EAL domain-containing protein n=1 Tax=Pseudomonas sp. ANT_J12 TaxID=2597351 RepID=UPI0011F125E0|nr:EAL domain-containing protein [Pseudomonas sp. ANT_J12]KAA0983003.1 EAL domain-containing protein [Pseudomonas sp. ANT_J12]